MVKEDHMGVCGILYKHHKQWPIKRVSIAEIKRHGMQNVYQGLKLFKQDEAIDMSKEEKLNYSRAIADAKVMKRIELMKSNFI